MNDYNGYINIPAGKSGAVEINHFYYPPGHKLETANMRCALFGGQKHKPVIYPHRTRWHEMCEGGARWMSDLPIEQAQHRLSAKGMRGRVLVGGLGLGLMCHILARRKTVKAITVVEINPDVVKLVAPYLPHNKPVDVVTADLGAYLKGYKGPRYDGAFYDIWRSDGEGTFHDTVVPLLAASAGPVKSRPVCWNEGVMRGQLIMGLLNKLLFVDNPDWPQSPTPLWEHDGTERPWHNWAVPFWRWRHGAKPDQARAEEAARYYGSFYGLPAFPLLWQSYTEMLP